METKTLSRENGFDLIRYYAAFSVMLLHYTGYSLIFTDQGRFFMQCVRKIVTLFPGVVVLFSLSGFLIASSYDRAKNNRDFLWKRVFRLYPELWVCTVFNLIVLFILAGNLFDHSMIVWLITQVIGFANTPSCLQSFATGSVNGALWTIFVELQLYLLLMILYPFAKKWSGKLWVLTLLLGIAANLLSYGIGSHLPVFAQKLLERSFFPYMIWFLIGMFCYIKRTVLLPLLKKYCPFMILIYIILYQIPFLHFGYYCDIMISMLCPFITIGLGYFLPAIHIKDFTYGMFLYHWIVLNVIIHFDLMNKLGWPVCLLLFLGFTMLLSWLSRILIGRNAAKLRKTRS